MTTLLERWDDSHTETMKWAPDEIRRALAIAQAVDERMTNPDHRVRIAAETILNRADELLRGEKAAAPQPPADKEIVLPPITINNDSKYYPDQVARMMREYGAACRAAALEEAARVCDQVWDARRGLETGTADECAAAIRALKDA